MPTAQYTALANLTLSGTASSVTFSSIVGTYRDLLLVANLGTDISLRNILMQFNSDTSTNYSRVTMTGNGTSALATTDTGVAYYQADYYGRPSANGVISWSGIWNIMDYSATDKHKTVLTRFGDSGDGSGASTGRWASTSAITSIKVYPNTENFATGSTFALYGVK